MYGQRNQEPDHMSQEFIPQIVERLRTEVKAVGRKASDMLGELPSKANDLGAVVDHVGTFAKSIADEFLKVLVTVEFLAQHVNAQQPAQEPVVKTERVENPADPQMRELLVYVNDWLTRLMPKLNEQHQHDANEIKAKIKLVLLPRTVSVPVDNGPAYHHDETPPERTVPRYPDK